MNDNFYIYVYLDPRKPGKYVYENYVFDYEPFYVGMGKNNRLRQHLYEAYNHRDKNIYKCNIIRKIKEELNIEPIIIKIKENLNIEDAKKIEINLIKIIGKKKNNGLLVNISDGGDLNNSFEGHKHSEESKNKTSNKLKGKNLRGNRTEEDNKKTSEAIKKLWKEVQHPWIGKHHTEETKIKISIANKNKLSGDKNPSKREDVKVKISEKLKGRVFDKEWLQNMSIVQRKYKYILIDIENNKHEIYNLKTFCQENNLTPAGVRIAIAENRKYKSWIVKKELLKENLYEY